MTYTTQRQDNPVTPSKREGGVLYLGLLQQSVQVRGTKMESKGPITASAFRWIVFVLIAGIALIAGSSGVCQAGEIKPKSGATSYNTYVWDGKELKPKLGATSKNTWLFDGEEIKKKVGATASNTYVWTGSQFKPKAGASSKRTWIWSENELKPQLGATAANTWKFDRSEWSFKQGATSNNTWVVTGSVPIPVSALVILRLN